MNLKTMLLSCLSVLFAASLHAALPQGNPSAAVNANPAAMTKVSINKATQQQLEAIPGIGSKKALAILDYIKAKGPIKSREQLMEVKGIGEKMATRIAELVSFN